MLDCPDPRSLARFYADLLGMRINEDDGDGAWVVIGRDEGWRRAGLPARGPAGSRRGWPDPQHPQQEHLDIRVDDVEAAQAEVLRLGATLLEDEQGTGFRVFADPAGHPFCLVY